MTRQRQTSTPTLADSPVCPECGKDTTGFVAHEHRLPGARKEQDMAEKTTRILEDPIANQELIRMRAKWAAQRADVVVARFEAKDEAGTLTPEDRKAFTAAKRKAAAAWKNEERELKLLRKMREAAKTASKPDETAVA